MARVRPVVVVISFSLAFMLACEGEGPALLEGDVMAVYEAALEAVLDSIGISEDDRLLLLDRYVMFEEVTSSEDGTPTPSEAELAVVTYIYDRGGIFGDGHQIRVVNDGRSWVVEDVQHVVVPE